MTPTSTWLERLSTDLDWSAPADRRRGLLFKACFDQREVFLLDCQQEVPSQPQGWMWVGFSDSKVGEEFLILNHANLLNLVWRRAKKGSWEGRKHLLDPLLTQATQFENNMNSSNIFKPWKHDETWNPRGKAQEKPLSFTLLLLH